MTLALCLLLGACSLAPDDAPLEKPGRLGDGIASDKGKEFLELVEQYGKDRRARPGGPKIGQAEFATLCVEIADRNPHVRPHALIEAIRMAPDTAGAGEAVDRFLRDFATDPGLAGIDQILIYSPNSNAIAGRTTERLLRGVLEKNPSRYVKGLACYCLALSLEGRTEVAASLPAREVDKLLDESSKLFERASKEFPDIPSQGSTVGKLAEAEARKLDDLRPGRVAPVARGPGLAGETIDLADQRGKVVLLSFWATWCGPCMAAIPHEREMARRLEQRPFRLIGVNGDEDAEKAAKVARDQEITWPSLRNGGSRGPLSDQWRVDAWPTLYLIDHKGVIRRRFVGFPGNRAAFDKLVDSLVAECEKERGDEGK
jgi:thiol-disulfide isomerase/thioredoxin